MRGWLLSLICVATLALASGARSADPPDAPGHPAGLKQGESQLATTQPPHPAQGHGAEEEGDLFGKALDLGIWTLVVFGILALVLRRYAWGPMLQGLEQRERSIRSAIDDAERAREEARQMREQLQREMASAQQKVREVMEQAHRDAQRAAEMELEKARGEIKGERERLHREIEHARDQALEQILARAAELATRISSKVIRRQLTADDHRRLVDEALADLQHAAGNGKH